MVRRCSGRVVSEIARAACAPSARDQHRALRQHRIRSFRSDYRRPEDTPTMEQTRTGSRVNQPLRQSITDPRRVAERDSSIEIFIWEGENLGFANVYFRNGRDCLSRADHCQRVLRVWQRHTDFCACIIWNGSKRL